MASVVAAAIIAIPSLSVRIILVSPDLSYLLLRVVTDISGFLRRSSLSGQVRDGLRLKGLDQLSPQRLPVVVKNTGELSGAITVPENAGVELRVRLERLKNFPQCDGLRRSSEPVPAADSTD
jgi:hypothetical protein